MTQYTVTFDRIGRNKNPQILVAAALDHDELAGLIRKHCRPHLTAHTIDIAFEKDMKSGFVYSGFHVASEFKISVPPVEGE